MSPTANAIRNGMRRGWIEFTQSIRSPQDQGFYLFTLMIVLAYLLFNLQRHRRGHRFSPVPDGRDAEHPGGACSSPSA